METNCGTITFTATVSTIEVNSTGHKVINRCIVLTSTHMKGLIAVSLDLYSFEKDTVTVTKPP